MPRRNLFFTGRDNDLQTLHSLLSHAGDKGIIYAVSGLGGIGKTALAVEYAYRFADDYAFRFFVNASSPTTLTEDYRRLAALVGNELPADASADLVIQTAKSWLDLNSGYLLIVDNADFSDDYTPVQLQALLPDNPKGHLLITSRAQVFSGQINILPNNVKWLDSLELPESLALLINRIHGVGKTLPAAEQSAALELAKRFGGLPLALEQAAAYIAAKQTSLSAYLVLYEKKAIFLLEKAKPETGNYSRTAAVVWRLNFEEVEENCPAAADLLTLCAFLAPDAIPIEVVVGAARGTLPSVQEFMGSLDDADIIEAMYNELLEPLTRYSLVHKNFDALTFNCHRMVQAVLRESLGAEGQRIWLENTVNSLFAVLPLIQFHLWGNAARLLPHIQALLVHCQAGQYASEPVSWLSNQMGLYLAAMGDYPEAERLYLHSLEGRRNLQPPNPLLIAQSLNNLADLYRSRQLYPQSEALSLEVLQIYKEAQVGEHAVVAIAYNNLGLLYTDVRSLPDPPEVPDAEPLYQEALRIFEQDPLTNAAALAQCKSNLALFYDYERRYPEAEKLCREVLTQRRQMQPQSVPDIGQSTNNLALICHHQKRYPEAVELYREALQIWEEVLPPNHPNLLFCRGNLAQCFLDQERFQEAEAVYSEVAEVICGKYGADDERTQAVEAELQKIREKAAKQLLTDSQKEPNSGA